MPRFKSVSSEIKSKTSLFAVRGVGARRLRALGAMLKPRGSSASPRTDTSFFRESGPAFLSKLCPSCQRPPPPLRRASNFSVPILCIRVFIFYVRVRPGATPAGRRRGGRGEGEGGCLAQLARRDARCPPTRFEIRSDIDDPTSAKLDVEISVSGFVLTPCCVLR